MKVVIDTNVLFSAMYRPGSVPDRIVEWGARERLQLLAPDTVREEMVRTVLHRLHTADEETVRMVDRLPVLWIPLKEYEIFRPDAKIAIAHEDDAPLVAVAVLAGAGIVSGDKAFHPLLRPVVKTWTPSDLVRRVEKQ